MRTLRWDEMMGRWHKDDTTTKAMRHAHSATFQTASPSIWFFSFSVAYWRPHNVSSSYCVYFRRTHAAPERGYKGQKRSPVERKDAQPDVSQQIKPLESNTADASAHARCVDAPARFYRVMAADLQWYFITHNRDYRHNPSGLFLKCKCLLN